MNFNILQYPVDHDLEPTLIKHHREYLNWRKQPTIPICYYMI